MTSSVFIQTQEPTAPHRIYATVSSPRADRQALLDQLSELAARGRITERDEALLVCLSRLNVLSLDQVHRLWWPKARQGTAYQRLYILHKHRLLASARMPRAGMQQWGLPVCKVYALGDGGRLWLRLEVDGRRARHLRRDQVLHDLLVAEVMLRLTEAARRRGSAWSAVWAGEQQASFYERQGDAPLAAPDGLAVVQARLGAKRAIMPLFVELDASREAHGRPSSDWGRKVAGYDRFYASEWSTHPALGSLPSFPAVAVITHGEARLLNLAHAIQEHRRAPVVYYLALWEDLVQGQATVEADILTRPAWLVVPPQGELIGEERAGRQALLGEPRHRKTAQPHA
jgi:DNA-binding PadR family transcriptional regulator